jgi:hypothetical protein
MDHSASQTRNRVASDGLGVGKGNVGRSTRKRQREWGYVRKQGTKSGRYQASYIGPDLRRHFAPVTFSSKMNAEAWLAKEKDLIEKATYNEDYIWQAPEARKLEKKAQALTLAEYSALWIEQESSSREPKSDIRLRCAITSNRSWAGSQFGI